MSLNTVVFRFFDLKRRHDGHKAQGELAVLREANVVGMTTTGVAMHQTLVEALGASIVVVEEAAEARICANGAVGCVFRYSVSCVPDVRLLSRIYLNFCVLRFNRLWRLTSLPC